MAKRTPLQAVLQPELTPEQKAERAKDIMIDTAQWSFAMAEQNLNQRLEYVESGLERILREVKRAREQYADKPVDAAYSITHEVMWGLANLHVDDLVRHAAAYEGAVRVKRLVDAGAVDAEKANKIRITA